MPDSEIDIIRRWIKGGMPSKTPAAKRPHQETKKGHCRRINGLGRRARGDSNAASEWCWSRPSKCRTRRWPVSIGRRVLGRRSLPSRASAQCSSITRQTLDSGRRASISRGSSRTSLASAATASPAARRRRPGRTSGKVVVWDVTTGERVIEVGEEHRCRAWPPTSAPIKRDRPRRPRQDRPHLLDERRQMLTK